MPRKPSRKTVEAAAKAAERPLEISSQSLEVARQCISQVPVKSGQQGVLLTNALLEIEAVLTQRGQPVAPAEEPAAE